MQFMLYVVQGYFHILFIFRYVGVAYGHIHTDVVQIYGLQIVQQFVKTFLFLSGVHKGMVVPPMVAPQCQRTGRAVVAYDKCIFS